MSSEKRAKIGSLALLGMTISAVFGLKNIINNNLFCYNRTTIAKVPTLKKSQIASNVSQIRIAVFIKISKSLFLKNPNYFH